MTQPAGRASSSPTVDLAAEDTDSDAYRDLLREIDRAFQGFDRMAVRHGWVSGGAEPEAPADETSGTIDLPRFVASVLTPAADGYQVPAAWAQDLDGLSGFDRATGMVRLTNDPDRFRDDQGRTLLYPGRSHPLTRRAIASVRTGRVSMARGDTVSLLVTYSVEVGSLLRRIFALLMYPDGSITEQSDFLLLARQQAAGDGSRFAGWETEAGARATAVADRITSAFMVAHRERIDRASKAARAWLERRTNELCGEVKPWIGDLFDTEPSSRVPLIPEQRLAQFAADPSLTAAQRRDAVDVLTRFRSICPDPSPLPPRSLRILGLLMLVP